MTRCTLALLSAAVLCFAAAPAGATIHAGKTKSSHPSVLLHGNSGHGHIGALPFGAIRLDLGRHDNGRHLGQLKHKGPKDHGLHGKLKGTGGPVRPPQPPSHDDVPMPEPSAALMFALGTGIVGISLRRRA